jgi:hypothetical protein
MSSNTQPVRHAAALSILPCFGFVAGTKITCKVDNVEQDVTIENMKPNMLVKTSNGQFRPVDKIGSRVLTNPSNAERTADRLYTIPKSKYASLTEDLVITGNRSLLIPYVDDEQRRQMASILGRIVVTDKLFSLPAAANAHAVPYTVAGDITVYDFSVSHAIRTMNYGVYANGLLVDCSSMVNLMNPLYTLIQ